MCSVVGGGDTTSPANLTGLLNMVQHSNAVGVPSNHHGYYKFIHQRPRAISSKREDFFLKKILDYIDFIVKLLKKFSIVIVR